jgi:hypothetical protein
MTDLPHPERELIVEPVTITVKLTWESVVRCSVVSCSVPATQPVAD